MKYDTLKLMPVSDTVHTDAGLMYDACRPRFRLPHVSDKCWEKEFEFLRSRKMNKQLRYLAVISGISDRAYED